MIKKMCMVALLFMVFPVMSSSGIKQASAGSDPLMQLQKSIDDILLILQSEDLKRPDKKGERKEKILAVVNDMFDFRAMARSSLGQNWNNITDAERDQFVGLFSSLIEQRYIGKIDSYNNQKVVYKDKRVNNDQARIYTAIIDKNLEIPIDYSLEKSQGRWLVRDLRIENVSLIANYRRDFSAIIRKEQFAGLVEKITEQLEKAKTQN